MMDSKRSITNTVIAFLIGVGVIVAYFILQIVFFGLDMIFASIHEAGSSEDMNEVSKNVLDRYYSTAVIWYFVCSLVSIVLILLVLLLLKKFRKSNLISEFGLTPRVTLKNTATLILCVLSGMALNISLSSFISVLPLPEKWYEANAESVNSLLQGNVVFVVLSVVIMPPIVEELIFRGVFHNLLRRAIPLPEKWAIAVSGLVVSVAFGVFHGNILQGLYTCFVSFVLIYIFESTGYLLACIFFHLGFNGSAVLEYLLGSFYNPEALVENTIIFGLIWVGLLVAAYFTSRKKSERIGTSQSVNCG